MNLDSSHVFHLSRTIPQEQNAAGSRTKGSKQYFPAIRDMSLALLVLHQNGVREPHWHPNADEMSFCLTGQALVTIYGNGDLKETFVVNQGEVFFVPSGYLHHIENIGHGNCEFIIQFSNEEPEDFGISASLGMFSNAVLGNTWGLNQEVFKTLTRSTEATFITHRKSPAIPLNEVKYSSPYKYNLDAAQPILVQDGGTARMARQNTWPILANQALYVLQLNGKGMREPHWHPKTTEIGYIRKGQGRMSILNPKGNIDTYMINQGDIYFVPAAYPHHIENLNDNEDFNALIFFNQSMPEDIGFSASVKAYSNEVLGATMHVDPAFFNQLTTYYKDLFIVSKINPVD